MSDQRQQKPMVKLGALWRNREGDGMSGTMGDARLVLLPNKWKKESKHPDFYVYVAEGEKREGKPKPPHPQEAAEERRVRNSGYAPSESADDGDEIQW